MGESWPKEAIRMLDAYQRLVPEDTWRCVVCGGDGCACCVHGISIEVVSRIHAQGQRDMLAKCLRDLMRDRDDSRDGHRHAVADLLNAIAREMLRECKP